MVKEITVKELHQKIENDTDPFILDVREPDEYDFVNIEGELIPLGELPQRVNELKGKEDEEIVVMCRSGARSAQACLFLYGKGFDKAVNLKGGIIAWAKEIDNSLPTY